MDYYKDITRMSQSRFKSYMECSAKAFAEQIGEYVRPQSKALAQGSYVDQALTGEETTNDLSCLFKQNGELYSDCKFLETIVDDIRGDALFMEYLTGETQKQLDFEIDGMPWKGKPDYILNDKNMVVDLKTAVSMTDWNWSNRFKGKVPFYYSYGYDIQGATYCHATGLDRFILAICTKSKQSARYLIEIPKEMLDNAMMYVRENQEKVWEQVKGENIEYCDNPNCPYCASRKKTVITMAEVFIPGEQKMELF